MCEPHFSPYDKLEEALLEVIRNTCKQYIDNLNIFELSRDAINSKNKDNQVNEQINELRKRKKRICK